jgi:hypothetical protein
VYCVLASCYDNFPTLQFGGATPHLCLGEGAFLRNLGLAFVAIDLDRRSRFPALLLRRRPKGGAPAREWSRAATKRGAVRQTRRF